MCTLDTLPMEMEASTVDSSPDAAGPMLAQPVVPQDVHEPQPVQTGQVAQAHVVQQIAPPVTPVTQASPMPSRAEFGCPTACSSSGPTSAAFACPCSAHGESDGYPT